MTEGTLYRRGNFNGSGDQLLLDALMDVQGAEIAFSPGFRWGTSLLAGQAITREWLMDMTATTYSYATVTPMTGETIKTILEDVCDNLFNPDPYYQQGGDMVRVGGLEYSCNPLAAMGKRIDNLRLNGKPLEATRQYKVAGWAPVAEEARSAGNKPVWELVEQWLKAKGGTVTPRKINIPQLTGGVPNAGYTTLRA
jgi:S-sulfosulfanyl-L-cysteine sulfohydrolase